MDCATNTEPLKKSATKQCWNNFFPLRYILFLTHSHQNCPHMSTIWQIWSISCDMHFVQCITREQWRIADNLWNCRQLKYVTLTMGTLIPNRSEQRVFQFKNYRTAVLIKFRYFKIACNYTQPLNAGHTHQGALVLGFSINYLHVLNSEKKQNADWKQMEKQKK